jgi:hypothetical protein
LEFELCKWMLCELRKEYDVIVLVSCCSIVLLASSYFYWLSADSFLLETVDGTGDCKSEIYYCLYLFSLTVPAVRKSGAHGRINVVKREDR